VLNANEQMTAASRLTLLAASPALAPFCWLSLWALAPVAAIGIDEGLITAISSMPMCCASCGSRLLQAGLSTLISLMLAIPVALAFARRRFLGAQPAAPALRAASGAPAIVVISHRHGLWPHRLALDAHRQSAQCLWPGRHPPRHVFFNLRSPAVLLQQLDGIAPESWRLAAQLDFTQELAFT